MRTRLAVLATAALALAAPAATQAAEPHLTPAAWAKLTQLTANFHAGPASKSLADYRAWVRGACQPPVGAAADQQTRWVQASCDASVDYMLGGADLSECPRSISIRTRCMIRPLRRIARGLRGNVAYEARLARSLTGDCRAFFRYDDGLSRVVIERSERLARTMAAGQRKRFARDFDRWRKAYYDPEPGRSEAKNRLMRGCDPATVPPPPPPTPA